MFRGGVLGCGLPLPPLRSGFRAARPFFSLAFPLPLRQRSFSLSCVPLYSFCNRIFRLPAAGCCGSPAKVKSRGGCFPLSVAALLARFPASFLLMGFYCPVASCPVPAPPVHSCCPSVGIVSSAASTYCSMLKAVNNAVRVFCIA